VFPMPAAWFSGSYRGESPNGTQSARRGALASSLSQKRTGRTSFTFFCPDFVLVRPGGTVLTRITGYRKFSSRASCAFCHRHSLEGVHVRASRTRRARVPPCLVLICSLWTVKTFGHSLCRSVKSFTACDARAHIGRAHARGTRPRWTRRAFARRWRVLVSSSGTKFTRIFSLDVLIRSSGAITTRSLLRTSNRDWILTFSSRGTFRALDGSECRAKGSHGTRCASRTSCT
jgi:hypothetical protein